VPATTKSNTDTNGNNRFIRVDFTTDITNFQPLGDLTQRGPPSARRGASARPSAATRESQRPQI
jgi:hypothetical protein